MFTRFRLAVLVPLLALGACQTETLGPTNSPAPAARTAPLYQPGSGEDFREADFAWSRGTGAGGITGLLTFHDGGTRYSCRGRDVILTPETPWVRRRMYILYGSLDAAAVPVDIVRARTPAASSGDYASYARKTTCDMSNRFSFQGLPDGVWYVITLARPDDGTGTVAIMRRVEVRGTVRTIELD